MRDYWLIAALALASWHCGSEAEQAAIDDVGASTDTASEAGDSAVPDQAVQEVDGPEFDAEPLDAPADAHGEVATPAWVPTGTGPWFGALFVAISTDGLNFGAGELLLERAGVPNTLKTPDGTVILTYQYFSYASESDFNVIAASISTDEGETWQGPTVITIDGLPSGSPAVDPSLVRLANGRLRLYFTFHPHGAPNPVCASAIGDSVEQAFQYEGTRITHASEALLDPAVVEFKGLWHYYTWRTVMPGGPLSDNYHAVSSDGLSFGALDTISLGMSFLGNPIVVGDSLRFYGTGRGGVLSASSTNGVAWTLDAGVRIEGMAAEGAPIPLADGRMRLIYTARMPGAPARTPPR